MYGTRDTYVSIFEKYAYNQGLKRAISSTASIERHVRSKVVQESEKERDIEVTENEEDIDYDIYEDAPYVHCYAPFKPQNPIRVNRGYTGRSDLGWERKKAKVTQSDLAVRYITEETDGKRSWFVSSSKVPFVYIWYVKDGWFLLRQIMDIFIRPNMSRKQALQDYLRKCNIEYEDKRDGCSIISLTANPFTSIWKELENSGVTTPWCICCSKVKPKNGLRRCRTIHLINLQAARMLMMRTDAPCRNVFPLLEAIITLTRNNARKRALTEADKQRVLMAQLCLCAECHEPILESGGYDVHHKFRVCDGGTNADINLVALHPSCHRKYTERERNRPFTPFSYTTIEKL